MNDEMQIRKLKRALRALVQGVRTLCAEHVNRWELITEPAEDADKLLEELADQ